MILIQVKMTLLPVLSIREYISLDNLEKNLSWATTPSKTANYRFKWKVK